MFLLPKFVECTRTVDILIHPRTVQNGGHSTIQSMENELPEMATSPPLRSSSEGKEAFLTQEVTFVVSNSHLIPLRRTHSPGSPEKKSADMQAQEKCDSNASAVDDAAGSPPEIAPLRSMFRCVDNSLTRTLALRHLSRYSTRFEVVLNLIGLVAAIAAGAGQVCFSHLR
jgi:hypothetical protein